MLLDRESMGMKGRIGNYRMSRFGCVGTYMQSCGNELQTVNIRTLFVD